MSTIYQGSIEERVKKCVLAQMAEAGTKASDVPSDATLVEDAGFDSLDVVEMTMALEDEFGIEIDDEQMAALTTVQQVIDLVFSKV